MKKICIFFFFFYLFRPAWAATSDYVIVQEASPLNFSNGDTITFTVVAYNNTNTSGQFYIVDGVPAGLIVTSVTGVAPAPIIPPLSSTLDFTGGAPLTIGPPPNEITIPANSAKLSRS